MAPTAEKPALSRTHLAVMYTAGWYFFSMAIAVYNKWMFGPGLNFRFPLFVTAFHQICLLILSSAVLYFRPKFRPSVNPGAKSFFSAMYIPPEDYIVQILPCSLASAAAIALSNVSLQYISLSLYTMLKTASLIFVLIFGLLLRLEKFNWRLIVIVVIMCFSVMMMTSVPESASPDADGEQAFGIILLLTSCIGSGLRWTITQLLMKKNNYTNNSISTIFYLAPSMTLTVLLFALYFEGWAPFASSEIWKIKGIAGTIMLFITPGVLAFMMTLSGFLLLSVTKVLTLSISGIFKEVLTVILGTLIFGDVLSPMNVVGLIITFADIMWYNYYRHTESKNENGYKPLDQESQPRDIELDLKRH